MSDTIKSIAIATDSLGNYETRDIGADAINVDVSYDADGNVITDAETTVATKKSSAEAIKGINETLAADAEAINGKAPTSHASADTTYGIATSEKYGHVMLLDNISKIGVRTDIKENSGTGVSYRGMQNLVKDLKPLLSWSNDDSAPTRVPEVVLKPEDNDNVINYTYSFSFLSQLSEANAPDTIRLILDCGVETLPIMSSEDNTTSEILLTVGFANLDSGSNYYSYTLTEADKAYGYKYLESSTTTTTADDSGNSTETTTQTYTYRIDALLHKHVDVTSGEYSWSVEVVPNEKYLNNKCNEISAALDISSIPSDLGTTAGSAINALNTHLTDGTVNAGKLQDYSFRLQHNTNDTWIPVFSNKNIDYILTTEMGGFSEQSNRGGYVRFRNLIVACIHAQVTSDVAAWCWSIAVPKPKFTIDNILDVTGSYRFQINSFGVFQNQSSISSGTYITVFVGYIAK